METKGNDPINIIFDPNAGEYTSLGLSKREYFAALALMGLMSGVTVTKETEEKSIGDDIYAREAVLAADALIKALNEKKGE